MIEINGFNGLRNDVALERFKQGDLASAMNVELDETGKIARRLGTSRLASGRFHSVWADGREAFVVRNGVLQQIMPDLTLREMAVPINGTVAYQRVGRSVYWTDGTSTGVIEGGENRSWGMQPPTPVGLSTALGAMVSGSYLVTMTYMRADGRESGAAPLSTIRIDAHKGLELTLPVSDDPQVVSKRVYVSESNGELPYLAATLENSITSTHIAQTPAGRAFPVRTLLMGPPPAGEVLGYYNGRVYVADGSYLWYSQPYEYELFHRAEGFLGFPSRVRVFAPVSDGVFVGLDEETVFLQGSDPTQFIQRPVASYGAVKGTLAYVEGQHFGEGDTQGTIPLWMSKRGVVAGFVGGAFKNLTGGRYSLPDGVLQGASLLKMRGGTPQFVTSLFR